MMFAFFFTLLVSAAADEPALELIPIKSVAATPWNTSHGVIVAPKVGVFAGSGPATVMASFAAEIGWAAPWLDRTFALSLEPGFLFSQGARNNVLGRVEQRNAGFVLPLLLSFNRGVGPGLLRVLAGPVLFVLDGKSRTGASGFDTTQLSIGADAGVSYVFWLGPGGLGLDVRYRAQPQVDVNRSVVGHGVVAQVTYLLPL